jgi:hypothetical protein
MNEHEPEPFVAIPRRVIRDSSLSLSAKVTYGVIISYAFNGRPCTTSADKLAENSGISRAGLYEAIAALRAAGLIQVEGRGKTRRIWPITTSMSVRIMDKSATKSKVTPVVQSLENTDSGREVEGRPSDVDRGQQSLLPPRSEVEGEDDARERESRWRPTYNDKVIPEHILDQSMRLLTVWNETMGRRCDHRRPSDGRMSAHLRQIVGEVWAREGGVAEEEWAAAIRHAKDNPPSWVVDRKSKIQIGDVFGDKAADHALAAAAEPSEEERQRAADEAYRREGERRAAQEEAEWRKAREEAAAERAAREAAA